MSEITIAVLCTLAVGCAVALGRESYVTNFDFTDHPKAVYHNGQAVKIGNFWYQNDYSLTSQEISVANGVLTFETSVDDEALIMCVDSADFADRSYLVRAVMKFPPGWKRFMYAGILIHADTGGTAHPETEGVTMGLMRESAWGIRCKQWTDGDIFGLKQGRPPLKGFDPNAWYTIQLQVKPRGKLDTQFSGRIWLCADQDNPTVADTGKLIAKFDDLWNPRCGEWDNSEDPQWDPRIHNIGLFQWHGKPIRFRSFGMARTEAGFVKPLVYAPQTAAVAGTELKFRSSAMLPAKTLKWDFGDGTSSQQPNPVKTYRKPGQYTVTLTATYIGKTAKAISEPVVVDILPKSGSTGGRDSFAKGTAGWRFEAKGLAGTPDSECDPNYITGHRDPAGGGALEIDAFNFSPGSPAQRGRDYTLDNWDLKTVSGLYSKPIHLAKRTEVTVSVKYRIRARGLGSNHKYKLLVLNDDNVVREIALTGNRDAASEAAAVTFQAEAGQRRLALGLWCETLPTGPVKLDRHQGKDSPTGSSPRRCDLITHRWDHWDDNGRVTVWFDVVDIVLGKAVGTSSRDQADQPKAGQILATYKVPASFQSLNGIAWDGKQLWGVDYANGKTGKAFRMDIAAAREGKAPAITRTLDLKLMRMEGAAHDRAGTLYVGPRTEGTRSSAQIIACDDATGLARKSYTRFTWPDLKRHGYFDPDGIAFDGKHIIWVASSHRSCPAWSAKEPCAIPNARP